MEGLDDNGDTLASCLVQWVRSFDGIREVQELSDLADGRALWTILQRIDASYFRGDLPEPAVTLSSDWTRKWQNLKHVERQVSMYYRDIGNGQEQLAVHALPDVKAIAAEASLPDTEKLIMAIIRAAMASPESNQKMAQRLMSLGADSAWRIANEIKSIDEAGYEESEVQSREESAYQSEPEDGVGLQQANGNQARSGVYQDPMLEREEQLLKAQATIDTLQATQSDAERQLQSLRQEKEQLQEAFDAYRGEIESKGRRVGGEDAYKKLQRQADNDRAYIDDLENQLQSSKGAIDNFERQIQRYKDDAEATQKLRDEVQLLKADNADLNQKIKANENLKKKIQTLQEQEKTNAALKDEVKQANERLEGLDRLRQAQASLEKEIIEKQGLIRNQEFQINELSTTRKHAEYDARMLAQKLQDARERHERDHEAMQDLKRRLQDSSLEDLDDAPEADGENGQTTSPSEPTAKVTRPVDDVETKHLNEKIVLLQQQLETSDTRLKQVSARNAELEDQHRDGAASASSAQKDAATRLEEHEQLISDLRKELESAQQRKENVGATAAASAAGPQDLATLQRENHLMTTAWFDLSARLQNNGVSLGRRRQDPKSWIARQRALVGPNFGSSR